MLLVDKKNKSTWTNWSGAHTCHPDLIFLPKSEEELSKFFKNNTQKQIRIVGSGHSFSPIVLTDTTLISLDEMKGLIDVDLENNVAEVYAGTKLHELSKILDDNRLALLNMGDIDRQSIAGALCSGTHGTGMQFGILSNFILALTIVTPQGEVLRFDESNIDELNLAKVNLGLFGVVTRMRLKVGPAYKLKYHSKKNNLMDTLNHLDDYVNNFRHFEFFWFPHTHTVQERFSNTTEETVNEKSSVAKIFDEFMENNVFNFISRICRNFPSLAPTISSICAFFMGTERRTNYSYKIFANLRDVKFQEMELAVDYADAKEVIKEIDQWIRTNKVQVHFPIEVRFTDADQIALSPCYQRKTCFIALHMYEGMPYEHYFKGIQKHLEKYNVRAHWGKMSFFDKDKIHINYPKIEDFRQLRRKLDPDNIMLNDWLAEYFK